MLPSVQGAGQARNTHARAHAHWLCCASPRPRRSPPCPGPRRRRRYFICDKKLLNLGWKEATSWEEGLAKTIAWYRDVGGQPAYWENGDLESALQAHPQLQKGLLGGRPPAK